MATNWDDYSEKIIKIEESLLISDQNFEEYLAKYQLNTYFLIELINLPTKNERDRETCIIWSL